MHTDSRSKTKRKLKCLFKAGEGNNGHSVSLGAGKPLSFGIIQVEISGSQRYP